MCCEQLARSFDFANSLCGLLLNHLSKARAYISNEATVQESLLNSSSFKIAFNVLNKLTNAHKLFKIDLIVKDLCYYLVEKFQAQLEYQPVYLQFLSNVLRNNSSEIERILKNHDKIRSFCRNLLNIIRNNNKNANLTLNSLIILIKLNMYNMFSIIWSVENKEVSSKGKTATHAATKYVKIFDSIDYALNILCSEADGHSSAEKMPEKSNDLINEKINALNFLQEFLNCQPVLQLLEK